MRERAALLDCFSDQIGATIRGCKNAPTTTHLESEDVCHVADAAHENYPSPWHWAGAFRSLQGLLASAETPLKDVAERQVLLHLALDGILQGQRPGFCNAGRRPRTAAGRRGGARRNSCGFQFAEPEDCAQTARPTRSTPKMSSGEYKRMDNTILADPRISKLLLGSPCHKPSRI